MKDYSLEEIYQLVGKDDLTAGIFIKPNTEAFKNFGSHIVMVVTYSQSERLELVKNIQNDFNSNGYIKGAYLKIEVPIEVKQLLLNHGILNTDIYNIDYIKFGKSNSFHSDEKRKSNKMFIPMEELPNGGDFYWMWGFHRQLVDEGNSLSPEENIFYLAGKLILEKELTEEEKNKVYDNGVIDENVEFQYLKFRHILKLINHNEKIKLNALALKQQKQRFDILQDQLQKSGRSFKILYRNDKDNALELLYKTLYFHERRLNFVGKFPIFLSLKDYLHIYFRHVEDYRVSHLYDKKDKFQWVKDDIQYVMKSIINEINDEVQNHFSTHPTKRYGRKDEKAIYFQGDYYEVFIEITGRVTTLYKMHKPEEMIKKS
jgi:hypothetical protein